MHACIINHYSKYNAMEKWTRVQFRNKHSFLWSSLSCSFWEVITEHNDVLESNIDFWFYREYILYNITVLILFTTQYLRIQETIYKMLDNFTKSLYVNTERALLIKVCLLNKKTSICNAHSMCVNKSVLKHLFEQCSHHIEWI